MFVIQIYIIILFYPLNVFKSIQEIAIIP